MIVDLANYYSPKPKQIEAHRCRSKYMLFGGAMGGGKSWFLCGEAIKQAMKYPGNRLVIVRKELSVLRRTTLVTFFSICPKEIIKSFNQSSLEVKFINGSSLTFLDANNSKDPLLQKLKGLEIGWFGIDEANEVSIDVYTILNTRLRWVLPNGQKPSYEGRLTSNPEPCWLVPVFIQTTNSDETYIRSLTTDNYDENSEYVRNLREAFKDSPNLLSKYLMGDWSVVDSINQLIPSQTILDCISPIEGSKGKAMGIDVARFGDDSTVFTVIVGGNVHLIESYPQTSINEVVTRAIKLMQDFDISPYFVGVDSVGVGAGVVDNLKALGYDVIEIQGGSKPVETEYEEAFKPYNLRSQMYYELRRDMEEGRIGNISNEALRLELQAIKYEIYADRTVKVIGKEAIKKLLGKSPDYADSLVYANWVRTFRGQIWLPLPISAGR